VADLSTQHLCRVTIQITIIIPRAHQKVWPQPMIINYCESYTNKKSSAFVYISLVWARAFVYILLVRRVILRRGWRGGKNPLLVHVVNIATMNHQKSNNIIQKQQWDRIARKTMIMPRNSIFGQKQTVRCNL
jgi:hypothetical protein